jgi:protein-L-isoaspartate(D-aspartate) O-methyltransferase
MPDWRERAVRMVAEVGVGDPGAAAAMTSVPRHWFVDPEWRSQAYDDAPLPIGPGATISAPHMVALQLEGSRLRPGLRVLEVGSGRGYLCALAAQCVGPMGRVFGIEFEGVLVEESRRIIDRLGLSDRVEFREGAGERGWKAVAPFDRIVVSHEVLPPLPPVWLDELREGGLVLVPLRSGPWTYLDRFRRDGSRLVRELRGPACAFVGSKSPPRR